MEGNMETMDTTLSASANGLMLDMLAQANVQKQQESFSMMKLGLEAFLAELFKHENMLTLCNTQLLDRMIAEIDRRLSRQMDNILHHENFKRLEAVWKGLEFFLKRTDFRQNIEISLLDVSKEELEEDFEDNYDVTNSVLYRHIYSSDYGQYGGHPVGAVVADYYFGPHAADVNLMRKLAGISAMSHAPVVGSAGPGFFGIENFSDMSKVKDLEANFQGPGFQSWNSFREADDSRYLGLTMPRFLLRLPYGQRGGRVKSFCYEEQVADQSSDLLWGNSVFAFACTLTKSFAAYRWCPNIIGPKSGGQVGNLAEYVFQSFGKEHVRIPTEILISDRREYELSEHGFIPLVIQKNSNSACFFSANSVQKPKKFGAGEKNKLAETNYRLGTQLPYLFIVTRLAHYLKVMQREQVGAWTSSNQIQQELYIWLRQYISDQENPPAEVRSRRPLRAAEIVVSDIPGEPGKYDIKLSIIPHFKYMGTDFTLSLKGRMEA